MQAVGSAGRDSPSSSTLGMGWFQPPPMNLLFRLTFTIDSSMLVATNTTVDENILAPVGVEFVFYWCHEPDIDSDTGDLQAPLTVAPF